LSNTVSVVAANAAGDSRYTVLRANMVVTLARPSCTSLRAWPISAEVKRSTLSPFSIRSRIRPDGPNCVVTVTPCVLPKVVAICAIVSRRLPYNTNSCDRTGVIMVNTARQGRITASRAPDRRCVDHHRFIRAEWHADDH
jgi:hypothetical protein